MEIREAKGSSTDVLALQDSFRSAIPCEDEHGTANLPGSENAVRETKRSTVSSHFVKFKGEIDMMALV
jgi:hypothetical protein